MVPIVGVIENMSYLECPHCKQHTHIFGKGGGQIVSEQFNIPFIGEIPLHPLIMTGSDIGKSVEISAPDSMNSLVFSKVAKTIAGRISVIATEMRAQQETESEQSNSNNSSSQTESSDGLTFEDILTLKEPFGVLIKDEDATKEKIKGLLKDAKKVVSVGDSTTDRLIFFDVLPDVSVIDNRERRLKRKISLHSKINMT